MAYLRLTNVTRNKRFRALNNPSFNYSKSNVLTTLPLPETGETQTNILKIEGVEAKVRVSFLIKNEASDVSEGTHPGGLTGFYDQLNFLIDNFVTETISENHRLELVDGANVRWSRDGVFKDIDIRYESARGELAEVNMEFVIGLVV